jgi:hypothetical protein
MTDSTAPSVPEPADEMMISVHPRSLHDVAYLEPVSGSAEKKKKKRHTHAHKEKRKIASEKEDELVKS